MGRQIDLFAQNFLGAGNCQFRHLFAQLFPGAIGFLLDFGLRSGKLTLALLDARVFALGNDLVGASVRLVEDARRLLARFGDDLLRLGLGSLEGFLALVGSGKAFLDLPLALFERVEDVFQRVFGLGPRDLGMRLVYDVCHNIAKKEEHVIDGKKRTVCVHRKGATRAFGPGNPDLDGELRDVLQLSGHFPIDATKQAIDALAQRGNFDIEFVAQEEHGVTLTLSNASQHLPAIFEAVAGTGGNVTETSLRSPNLETLFLLLTGKELRE